MEWHPRSRSRWCFPHGPDECRFCRSQLVSPKFHHSILPPGPAQCASVWNMRWRFHHLQGWGLPHSWKLPSRLQLPAMRRLHQVGSTFDKSSSTYCNLMQVGSMCTKLFHLQICVIIFLHVPTIFHRFPTLENTSPGTRPIPPHPPSCAQMRPAAPRAPQRRHRRQRLRPKPRRRRRPRGRQRRASDAWGRGKRTEILR